MTQLSNDDVRRIIDSLDGEERERRRMIREIDIDTAWCQQPFVFSTRLSVEVALHKTRLHSTWCERHLRQDSLDYLRAGRWKDYGGRPLPDEVPE